MVLPVAREKSSLAIYVETLATPSGLPRLLIEGSSAALLLVSHYSKSISYINVSSKCFALALLYNFFLLFTCS